MAGGGDHPGGVADHAARRAFSTGDRRVRRALGVAFVGVVGVAFMGSGVWVLQSRVLNDRATQVRALAQETSSRLSLVLEQYGDLLSGSAALFNEAGVTRSEYSAFLRAEGFGSAHFPGMIGLGYVELLSPAEVPRFLATLGSQGIVATVEPRGNRSRYCLGSYADWNNLATSIPLYGYDFCTVPVLSNALSQATRLGGQLIVNGSTLGKSYKDDFLMVQPVYRHPPATPAQRERQISGWVIAITDGGRLFASIKPRVGLDLLVYRGAREGSPASPVLRWPASIAESGQWAGTLGFEAYGRWTVRFRALPDLAPAGVESDTTIVLSAVGIVEIAIFMALLWSLLRSRARAVEEADLATESLALRERRFKRLVENSSDLIAVLNDKAELTYMNDSGLRILGDERGTLVGSNVLDLIHPDDRKRAEDAFMRDATQPGIHPPAVYRCLAAAGEWRFLEVRGTNGFDDPAVEGVVLNGRDVTESTNLARALRTLARENQVLVHATDEISLLEETCSTIVDAGGYALAWVGYVEHDATRAVRPAASAGRTQHLEALDVGWGDDERGWGAVGTAVRTRTIQILHDMSRASVPDHDAALGRGLRASCVLPLQLNSEVIGVLVIYATEAKSFGPDEVDLLHELADALGYGISSIRDASNLIASEERFRVLAANAPIGILEVAEGGTVTFANPRISEIAGTTIPRLVGRGWVEAIHPEDLPALLALMDSAGPKRKKVATTVRMSRTDGAVRHVKVFASPKPGETTHGYVVTVEDVTEEVLAREALAHQAFYDALTGLPNRALLLDRLNQEIARNRRDGSNFGVLFLDLDRFKTVNDTLGHDVGDDVLKEVGRRFEHAVRAGETAARFSGDEFVFIIRDVHDVDDARAAARRLLAVLESPIPADGGELVVTGSIGIALACGDADAATVLRNADTAMYHAKEAGRDRFELFDEELHRRVKGRLEMEADLRKALEHSEFELYYQPGIDMATGRPVAAEGLVRWHHPTRGLVAPVEFIPLAEELGLILPIGRWVLERSFAQMAEWDRQDDGPHLAILSVNLSVKQLEDAATLDLIRKLLKRHRVAPGRVALEVTESVVMSDGEVTRRALRLFKRLGLRVAIDDFGTGYSSLAYLHTLPVTTVKVDHSFIERLDGPDDSTPVVRAIVDMGHAMGLRIVAEGVGDERHFELAAALGCDFGQGYFWAPPMPAGEFAQWWRTAMRRVGAAAGRGRAAAGATSS